MKLAVLVLSALALVIAGCGSDDDTLTKAEFIKQADVICKKADDREAGEFVALAKSNPGEFEPPNVKKGQEKAIRVILIPSIQKQVKDVEALGIPEGDEEELERFFDEVESGLEKVKEDPLSIDSSREKSPLYGSFKLGQAYGFKLCREIY